MPAARIVVTGIVQGVGFRNWTKTVADRLGVSGEVWNRADGGVELLAAHNEAQVLDDFVAQLPKGPGWVGGVDRSPHDGEIGGPGFRIGPTR